MSAFPLLATRQRTSLEVGRSIDAGTGAEGSAEILAGESSAVQISCAPAGRSRPDGRGSFAIGRRSAWRLNA